MYARVLNGLVRAGKMDELVALVNEKLAPRVKERAGSRGMLLLTDLGSGRALSISLWDSEEAMLNGETSEFLDGQLSEALPLLEEAPSVWNSRVSSTL